MIDENPRAPLQLQPYPCEMIVYRAAMFPDWIKRERPPGKQIKAQAFYLLEGWDGVSVGPTPESCTEDLDDPTYGIISIKVGYIRNAGYDVVPDSPTHANIVGLPDRNSEDSKIRSTGEAAKLAKIARPYDPPANQ
jgi:hypothetical protein